MLSADSLHFITLSVMLITAIVGTGLFVAVRYSNKQVVSRQLVTEAESSVAFLFDDDNLIDATPAAKQMIGRFASELDSDFERFLRLFSPTFPLLRTSLSDLAERRHKVIPSPYDQGRRISAEYWDGIARLTYVDNSSQAVSTAADRMEVEAIETEIETLRAIAENAPQPIWEEEGGKIIWANAAYLELCDQIGKNRRAWPPERLFGDLQAPSEREPNLVERCCVQATSQGTTLWYDVTSCPRGHRSMHFAVDVGPVLQAEATQKNFVQTLGKIFGELSIGLAIFDNSRRLIVFNPALTELTQLSFDFLSSQPAVSSFLDRLRENRVFPEPRNYGTWRETIAELEASAKDGTYCENWDLPDGRIFRVTGRPHPNGAIAFLFEDISAEISSNRDFREQLDTAVGVLDQMPEAIAVFTSTGEIALTNAAYRRLWHGDEDYFLDKTSVFESIRHWQAQCVPSVVWSNVRDALCHFSESEFESRDITLRNGLRLECYVTSLSGGKSMVRFKTTLRKPSSAEWSNQAEAHSFHI